MTVVYESLKHMLNHHFMYTTGDVRSTGKSGSETESGQTEQARSNAVNSCGDSRSQ